MDFEESLTFEMDSIPGLKEKVFPGFSPGKKAPYLAYTSSDGLYTKTISFGYLDDKSVKATLHIIANKYDEMKRLERLVVKKLISFELRSIGVGGPFIEELTYEEPVELYEEKPNLYRCVINIKVYFKEVE